MKNKHYVITVLLVMGSLFAFPGVCEAYWVMLPDVDPPAPYPGGPLLPYIAMADHYNGLACLQMVLNTCPNIAGRHYHEQSVLLSRVTAHNTESGWFSDPGAMKKTLMDPVLSPCGSWVDASHTDKNVVLGKLLYWMKKYRYFAPVSVSSQEKWMNVIGYQSDVEPTSTTLSVTLTKIILYDPTPGAANPYLMLNASVWNSNSDYWGVAHNKPGSSWHNKYIAIIEPPVVNINVRIPQWLTEGLIWKKPDIINSFNNWLAELREDQITRGPFDILAKNHKAGDPVLVDTGAYKYYIVPFEDSRLVAIFNAYNGSFEEFRQFKKPQNYILNSRSINKKITGTLNKYKVKKINLLDSSFQYNSEQALNGRFSPTWQVQARVIDAYGKKQNLMIVSSAAGEVVKGLESLKPWKDRQGDEPPIETTEKKPSLFSIHIGTAVPIGNFSDFYKAGFNIVGDIELPLMKQFSLRGILGYNQFKAKVDLLDDTSIININLNLRFSTSGSPFILFGEAGPGYYIFKDADNKMGMDAGCGFQYALTDKISLEWAAHYNIIFTEKEHTRFLHLAGGLIFRF